MNDDADNADVDSDDQADQQAEVDDNNVISDEKKTDKAFLRQHKVLYQNCKALVQQTNGYLRNQMNILPVLNNNQKEDIKGVMRKTQHGFFTPQELQKRCKLASPDFLNQITDFTDLTGNKNKVYLPQAVCKILEDKNYHANYRKDTNKVLQLAESMFGKKYQNKQLDLIKQVHAFVPQISDFKSGSKARKIMQQYNVIKNSNKIKKAKNVTDANLYSTDIKSENNNEQN